MITEDDLSQLLIDQTPAFDERIAQSFEPADSWLGGVSTEWTPLKYSDLIPNNLGTPGHNRTQRIVRYISENACRWNDEVPPVEIPGRPQPRLSSLVGRWKIIKPKGGEE